MSGIKFVAIKPYKFQGRYFYQEFEIGAKEVAKGVEKDYKKTVSKWKKKPTFKTDIRWKGLLELTTKVWTDNDIYRFVDEGTKPHFITPLKGKMLRFIGKGYAGRGRPKQSDYVFTDFVDHPGFEGYHHSERIKKEWEPKFKNRMEIAMERAAKKSGHWRTK